MYQVKQEMVEGLVDTLAGMGGSITIINDLTTGGTTSVLSAEQGKVLKTALDAKKTITQADSTATTIVGLVADFNSLLAKLKSAGLMA